MQIEYASRDISQFINTTICGDAVITLNQFPDESIDLVLTDPPYNIGIDYGVYKDNLPQDQYYAWCKEWFGQIHRVLKRTGSFYVIQYPELACEFKVILDETFGRSNFRRWLTWFYRHNIPSPVNNWVRAQRTILYYTKSKVYTFNRITIPYIDIFDPRIIKRIKAGSMGRPCFDVIQEPLVRPPSKQKTEHPCQTPQRLVEFLIRASSNPGDIVLDPFLGSGTTAIAAQTLQRRWIGVELNKRYCEIAVRRLSQAGYHQAKIVESSQLGGD